MSVMNREIYEALKEAKVSEETAMNAAESLAAYDTEFAKLNNRMTHIDGRITLVQWMLGFNLAGTMTILWKLFG